MENRQQKKGIERITMSGLDYKSKWINVDRLNTDNMTNDDDSMI